MTLGEFAVAVGAPRRWVQNARAVLGDRAPYRESGARRLAMARELRETCRMPLRQAYALAADALAVWPAARTWTYQPGEGGAAAAVTVDLERFLSDYAARLSVARSFYAERRRGRPRARHGLDLARWYGVDVTLLQESLKRTPAERLRRLEDAAKFFKRARRIG